MSDDTHKDEPQGRIAAVKALLSQKAGDAFVATVRATANEQKAARTSEAVQAKYKGLPPDAIVSRLVKTARRKTKLEGAANGLAVTGAEAVALLPIPEPMHKGAAVAATVGLLLGDLTWVTKVQTQLALEIAHLYGVPYDTGDEDDIYGIFKLAMGLKGTERVASVGGLVATEAARKQFRRVLRSGGARRELQKRVVKWAGPKVGVYLSEKYVLRLIPALNAVMGYVFNDQMTKKVGYWATLKARVRSGSRKLVVRLLADSSDAAAWALPVVFWVGTAGEGDPSDNFYSHYAHTQHRLNLSTEELGRVTDLCDDDRLGERFAECLPTLSEEARRVLYDLAVLTAAMDLKTTSEQDEAVAQVAKWAGVDHGPKTIQRAINRLKP